MWNTKLLFYLRLLFCMGVNIYFSLYCICILMTSENTVAKKILGAKGEERTEDWSYLDL
jgi:hypothetical protein